MYYRLNNSALDINFANEQVANAFPVHRSFSASQVAVVTWDSIGYFNQKSDKVLFS